jgi:hypothetical protein
VTDEEVNRKFDTVAGHLATLAVSLQSLTATVDRVSGAVESLSAKVDRTAESVTALLAIAEIHDREIEALKDSQMKTGERMNALINTVERFISERRNGK